MIRLKWFDRKNTSTINIYFNQISVNNVFFLFRDMYIFVNNM